MAIASPAVRCDVVVPTIGRTSLDALLGALAAQADDLPGRVILVDDRREPCEVLGTLQDRVPAALAASTTVCTSGGTGPAAARNCGWRASDTPWIAFLDDDVVPGVTWARDLVADLACAPSDVAAVAGIVDVPLPAHRPPTDRERNVARLATAAWITADLAVRREVLVGLRGFDERFRRAYREDTDFYLRARAGGHCFARGCRRTSHPVAAAPWWISVVAQRGNADDALLRALHGPAVLERGRRRRHALVTVAGALSLAAFAAGRRQLAGLLAGTWVAGTAEFSWARIRPGPRTAPEVAAMVVTSVAIPPFACVQWIVGRWLWRDGASPLAERDDDGSKNSVRWRGAGTIQPAWNCTNAISSP